MMFLAGPNGDAVPARISPRRAVEGVGGVVSNRRDAPPKPHTDSQCVTVLSEPSEPRSSCPTTLTAGTGKLDMSAALVSPVTLQKHRGNGGEPLTRLCAQPLGVL